MLCCVGIRRMFLGNVVNQIGSKVENGLAFISRSSNIVLFAIFLSLSNFQSQYFLLVRVTNSAFSPRPRLLIWDHFYQHDLTLIPAWISNYSHYNVWDEIIYPFPNFNGCTVDVWEWISNFIPNLTDHVITYPCWD